MFWTLPLIIQLFEMHVVLETFNKILVDINDRDWVCSIYILISYHICDAVCS